MPKVTDAADFAKWDGWTGTSKVWNYHMPFHRLNPPPPAEAADGKGLPCGCRSVDDFDFVHSRGLLELLAKKIMHSIPNWVPVLPQNDQEREVEGILLRSIHSSTDHPVTQWHHWYDWNFHIQPALISESSDSDRKFFEYLMSPANKKPELTPEAEKMGFTNAVIRPWYDTNLDRTLECEWDLGGFGGAISSIAQSRFFAGPMFATDWAWPMSGQYVWLAGRWIYDCGHALVGDLMHTELHPCKAVATARWEAVQFPENENLFVPGIQFMFFASKWGGYLNFNTIHDKDYEFVVDLPASAIPTPVDYDIGHTPDFPRNTLVLRWDLLKKFDYSSFVNAVHDPTGGPTPIPAVDPIVELMEPFDPAKPQAKVTIPLTRPELRDLNTYGVIVSLGWRDPDRSQARRVKKCSISLDDFCTSFFSMKERDRIPEQGEKFMEGGTWRVRFAVNGRWFAKEFWIDPPPPPPAVHEGYRKPLGIKIVLHLSEEDGLHFSANGMIERTQGKYMAQHDPDDRTLRFLSGGGVIEWQRDIVGKKTPAGRKNAMEVFDALFSKGIQFTIFPGQVDENFPMGFIDPYVSGPGAENPLRVDEDLSDIPKIVSASYSLEAPTEEDSAKRVIRGGDMVEKVGMLDCFIKYRVTIEPQKV
jgi:hypothetical protein